MTQFQRTIITSEITILMETIREQFETLNSFEGRIPILEFEIIKDNIRKIYEKLYLLEKMNDPFDLSRKQDQEIRDTPSPDNAEKNEPVAAETISSSEPYFQMAEENNEPAEKETETVTMDLFTSETTAFNDKLKEAREQGLGARSRQSTPRDIKSLISINEKFLFINELFDGDYKEYSHNIETFNTFSEKGEAFDFLDSLLKNNLWNSSSPSFIKLKEIVEKRFI